MEQYDPIQALLDRAGKYRIPITDVCKRASVSPSTVWRWKAGKSEGSMKTIKSLNFALSEMIEEMMK